MKLLFIAFTFLVVQPHIKCEVSETEFKKMQTTLEALGRQVMLQQFFSETRVRTEGQSGIKAVRQRKTGLKNYFICLLYTSPSPRDGLLSRMPSSA